MTQKTALILDDDLGFAMWLGRALNEAGIPTLPSCRGAEALEIIANESFPRIDLAIVNFQTEGSSEVLEALTAQGRNCKVISIGPKGKRAVDGTLRRPRGRSLPPPDRYVKTVRDILT